MSLGEEQTRTAELRAMAHPLRLRMLSLLTGAPMSAAEVARELGITHANASYHLRQLHGVGAIAIADEQFVRGGRAKRYRYDVDRDLETSRRRRNVSGPARTGPPSRAHLLVYGAVADEMRRRAAMMVPGDGNWLTDAELWVDGQRWREVSTRIAEAAVDLHRAAVAPHDVGAVRVNATIALFAMRSTDETTDPADDPDGAPVDDPPAANDAAAPEAHTAPERRS